MINFSNIDQHKDVAESIHKKLISNETEHGSAKNPLRMRRTGLNETTLVSEILLTINDKNVVVAPWQGKK